MTAGALFALVRLCLSGATLCVAAVLIASALIGMLRFPDFYTRLHAFALCLGLGVPLGFVALAISAERFDLAVKLLLSALLLAALAPALNYFLANAGHAGGLTPLSGAYSAPRPGEINRNLGTAGER